jgi:hypothetical protein
MAFRVEPVSVEAGNAAGLLSAMLERVETKGRNGAGVWHIIDPEDAAFETGAVVIRLPMFWR